MAHLDVQPKITSYSWLWILLAVLALAIIIFLLKGRSNNSDSIATTDSTASLKSGNDTTVHSAVAVTKATDWDGVNFNSPVLSDADINDKDISIRGNDKYTIYTLGENVLFATDKNILQTNAVQKLAQISSSLSKRYKGATIGIYGNTDSTGDKEHNNKLGVERAAAVKDWLVQKGNIDANKISIHSLGASKPVASNATATGRQQNRNVEIVAFANEASH